MVTTTYPKDKDFVLTRHYRQRNKGHFSEPEAPWLPPGVVLFVTGNQFARTFHFAVDRRHLMIRSVYPVDFACQVLESDGQERKQVLSELKRRLGGR